MSENAPSADAEIFVIVCQPYGSYNEVFQMIPGSTATRACCGHLVWISPQAEAFQEDHPKTIVACTGCRPQTENNYLVPGAREAAARECHGDDVATFEAQIDREGLREWPGR